MSRLYSKLEADCTFGNCYLNIGVGIAPHFSRGPKGEVNPEKYDVLDAIFKRYIEICNDLKATIKEAFRVEVLDPMEELKDNHGKYNENHARVEMAALSLAAGSYRKMLDEVYKEVSAEGQQDIRAKAYDLIHAVVKKTGEKDETLPPVQFPISSQGVPQQLKDMADESGLIDLRAGKYDELDNDAKEFIRQMIVSSPGSPFAGGPAFPINPLTKPGYEPPTNEVTPNELDFLKGSGLGGLLGTLLLAGMMKGPKPVNGEVKA